MNKYEARWNNAKKQAEKINAILDDGGLIFNEEMEKVGRWYVEGNEILEKLSKNSTLRWYFNDKEWDDGCHTTIEEFNAYFKDWVFIYKKDINPFKV